MSNPSVGMVPRTEAWALRAGEEMHTACTTMVDGMTTLSEWKYRDLRNGSMKIFGTELPRSEEWNMNGNIEIRGFEVSGTKI